MENTYDFKISQPVLLETLEVYKECRKILAEEQSRLEGEIMLGGMNWGGAAAEATLAGLMGLFENGEYAVSCKKMEMVCKCIEEALSQINALLARCEGFADQFDSDDYVEPVKPAEGDNRTCNGGILAVNYFYGSLIPGLCEKISEKGHRVGETLKEVLYECGDLLEGSEEDIEAVDRAVRKLDRVLNYRDSYLKYESGIKALEYDFSLRLKEIESYPGNIATEGMEFLAGAGMPAAWKEPEEIREVLMQENNGEYGFEELLRREGELTAGESEALAMVFAEITAEPTEEKLMLQERYLRALYTDGSDYDKIIWIQSYLSASEEWEAYYTLQRMGNICLPEGSEEKYTIEVEQQGAHTVYSIYGIMQDVTWEFAARDLHAEFAPYMEEESEFIVNPLKLEEWIKSIGCDEDYRLTHGLITGDYRDAFGAVYEEVSPTILENLLYYEDRLYEAGTTDDVTSYLNGILYYNGAVCNYEGELPVQESRYNGQKYLYFLLTDCGLTLKEYGTDITPGTKGWDAFVRTTLYSSLYTSHSHYKGLENEEGYLRISNLSLDKYGLYTYDFNVMAKENILGLGAERVEAVEEEGHVDTLYYEVEDIDMPWVGSYRERAMNQMLQGAYSKDVTLWGTWAEIVYGFTPLDIPMDIRDMTYYMNRLAKGAVTAENIGMTIFCGLSIFGIGEVFAHWGKIKKLLKLDGSDLRTAGRLSEAAGDIIESSTKTVDDVLEEVRDVVDGVTNLKPQALLDELANSGVKYNPDEVIAVIKTADGKLVWLEYGTENAGLNHIIAEHADDFLNKGIAQEQIPEYVMNALENGKIVGYQGRGTGRPIYEFTYNGEIHQVAITVGNNGFVVGANPK